MGTVEFTAALEHSNMSWLGAVLFLLTQSMVQCQDLGSSLDNGQIQVSCVELKNMHHAVARARVAYHCEDKPSTGNQTECDQRILEGLNSCSSAESGVCFFELIAEEEVCYPPYSPDDSMCNALDRVYGFLSYARLAFCQRPDSRGSCSMWAEIGCTGAILAADAGCAVANIEDGEALLIPCISAVMGVGSSCVPCICDVLGIGC